MKPSTKNISLGPNGLTTEFLFSFFDLVGDYMVMIVEEINPQVKITGSLNSIFLSLIPKLDHLVTFGAYRKISL